MPVVGFLNSKGGVGKSTLCAAIAVRAAKDFPNVCLVDLDPQKSLADWWHQRGEPDNPRLIENASHASDAVKALRHEHCDWVFLDGPPGSLSVTDDAIKISEFVVIPMRPSSIDLRASEEAVAHCRAAGIPYTVIFTQCRSPSASDKLLAVSRRSLVSGRIPVADTAVSLRTTYVTAMAVGKTGAERDAAAALEIDALWNEIKAATLKAAKARIKAKRGGA